MKRTALGVATAALFAASLMTAPTASAYSYNGCQYPRVCFYLTAANWNNAAPTAAYQDITSGYQDLGDRSRGAKYVRNTREDDRASLRYVDVNGTARYDCLPPNSTRSYTNDIVIEIRIEDRSSC
ncbi:hypothetical protein GCM10011583_09740 [Streptomyces camponoticapitis]|uniref:Peptidase inhibitor family I36 n=1 Tax=Streptomyces camponoticapitis TaxID=1616125 RepID=A0ABQ2E022_9ACTN|nr:hypothetical protein [Streptomyces camponoticapitis]GGJ80249.1 hypothetical protein GCM10011583_09740 [Streptomyces camponoticapitis]